jgi:hypothetical protein
VRGFVSLMVHGVWGEALPHFPLYLVEALLVEATAAALLARRGPLVYGSVAGLLIGTVGTAAEWGWSHIWMPLPWPTALLPEVAVVSVLAGLAGGLVGTFIGTALLVKPPAVPARRAGRLPARRARRRRAGRVRPRHLAAARRERAGAAARRARQRAARGHRRGEARPAAGR